MDGKLIPKGQRVLLLDGSTISLVYPKPDDDPCMYQIYPLLYILSQPILLACVAFVFQDFLSTLPPSTLSLLESEYNDEDHVVVSKRLQQLQSSTQIMKNTKKPEYFIYVLKVTLLCISPGAVFIIINTTDR